MSNDQPNLGCSPVAPLSCESQQQRQLLQLANVGYFVSDVIAPSYPNITSQERCKEACLDDCSCKAAFFRSYPSYLHEECRQKIAHLDIKPENILLDSNFNAKVSDFGLSKLIDRDQSTVITMMRGTPGYLAPEWLTSIITEKVDVYSFGVVIIEIVCGRKNVDFSKPEGRVHLLPHIKEKAMAGELLDVIDKRKRDVHIDDHRDLVEMLKLTIWCIQYDPSKRPSMNTVVKVLEGAAEVTPDLDYNFGIPVQNFVHRIEDYSSGSTPLLPSSIRSGP